MSKPLNINPIRIDGCVLSGSFVDLSDLDFSSVNVKCYSVTSESFKLLSNQFPPETGDEYSLFNCIRRIIEKNSDLKYGYVLLPLDFSKPVSSLIYYKCAELLKIMFLTNLEIESVAEFNFINFKKLEWIVTVFYKAKKPHIDYDSFFTYPFNANKHGVNQFIELYFKRIKKMKYVQVAIEAFLASFQNMPTNMSFVSVCISMETLVDNKTEITYKIKRTLALLCADNEINGNIIFDNVREIYALRSKIVHGGTYKNSLFAEYLQYVRILVSVMIIKLIYLNEPTAIHLQKRLTFAGFDNMKNIYPDSNLATLNLFSQHKIVKPLKNKC